MLTEFQVFELPINRAGQTDFPFSTTTPTELGRITLKLDEASDRVWLNATVGIFSDIHAVITYRIFRNAAVPGTEIFSARDELEGEGELNNLLSHFSHVDNPKVTGKTPVTYILTAQATLVAPDGDATNVTVPTVPGPRVVGPITFTGAEIEGNRG